MVASSKLKILILYVMYSMLMICFFNYRKIFWSDWYRRNPRIEMADLDGRNREVLVQSPNVKTPNSLAIDWDSNEICWADADLKRIG